MSLTRFELLAFLHVIGTITWVGGGIGLVVLHWIAARAKDYQGLATAVRQSQVLGQWLFFPASMLIFVSGVLLVATEDVFSFGDLWILIGFAGIVLSPSFQMTVCSRSRDKFLALEAEGGDDAVLAAAARHVSLVNAIDIGILLVITWVMYARPEL